MWGISLAVELFFTFLLSNESIQMGKMQCFKSSRMAAMKFQKICQDLRSGWRVCVTWPYKHPIWYGFYLIILDYQMEFIICNWRLQNKNLHQDYTSLFKLFCWINERKFHVIHCADHQIKISSFSSNSGSFISHTQILLKVPNFYVRFLWCRNCARCVTCNNCRFIEKLIHGNPNTEL